MGKHGENVPKIIMEQFSQVKGFPSDVETWNTALDYWRESKDQFGKGANFVNESKSFLKNRLGLPVGDVANPQAFNSAMQQIVGPMVKQEDSQPAQAMIDQIRQSIGNIETDPDAIPKIFSLMYKLRRLKVEGHNDFVDKAAKNKYVPQDATEMFKVKVPDLLLDKPSKSKDIPTPSDKTVIREVKLKDGRIGVEYSDGSRGYK